MVLSKEWGDTVSERIAEAFWIAVLLVCVFSADQFLAAQPVSDEHKDPVSDEQKEKDICSQPSKYHYEDANGERHFVPYSVIDGRDVVEGDIVIGDAQGSGYFPPAVPEFVDHQATRWEGNVVPYVIDGSAEPYRALIRQAMSEWHGNTNITFNELSGPRDWKKENYVKFVGGKFCGTNSHGVKSKVGQPVDEEHQINVVWVGDCTFTKGDHVPSWGRIAHEIGHVLGLGHEQSRSDRDKNITVLWNNLDDKTQFCRGILETRPNTIYDFDSIMHYSPRQEVKVSGCPQPVIYEGKEQCVSFVRDSEKLQLQEKMLGVTHIETGQRTHLSELDVEAVKMLYPDTRPPQRTPPTPDASCCSVQRPPRPICPPDRCRRPVKVNWPRPDRWCQPGWCRPWPRPRPLCDRDGWSEGRPPFDDWDE